MNLQASKDWEGLRTICRRLRAPEGCQWDRAQTLETMTPYLLEEVHELTDAIAQGERTAIVEELGDLLYLLVFVVTMAEEERRFTFEDVVEAITTKLIRRHPHVFGGAPGTLGPAAVREQWESIKAAERASSRADPAKGAQRDRLASGAKAIPAMLEAYRVQEKAASFGFDWPELAPVLEKLEEECRELREALEGEAGQAPDTPASRLPCRPTNRASQAELGDILFAAVNVARHLQTDPETALRGTIRRFRSRFACMETLLTDQGTTLAAANLDTMEQAWQAAKAREAEGNEAPRAPSDRP